VGFSESGEGAQGPEGGARGPMGPQGLLELAAPLREKKGGGGGARGQRRETARAERLHAQREHEREGFRPVS
jgi:hypothetical protein